MLLDFLGTTRLRYYPARVFDVNAFWLVLAVIAGLVMAFIFLPVGSGVSTVMLLLPLIVVLVKPCFNLMKLLINYSLMFDLRKLAQSAGLVEYRDGVISSSVIFDYVETKNAIKITVYPNGVKNSDRVYQLSQRMSEIFGLTAFIDHEELRAVTYCMLKNDKRGASVNENEF